MHRFMRAVAFAGAALQFLAVGAFAQIAVSAQDGKAVLVDGANTVPANPPPDYVAIIDLGGTTPKVIGEVSVPASVVGPPQSVAVAADESFALVTAAAKVDPADPKKLALDDKLSVIDLKSSPPKVLATLQAGKGAAGVSINRAGTLALVANRGEGTVSIFTVAGNTLTPAGKLDLGNDKSGPSHVAFTPDGKTALLTRDGDHKISVLTIDGNKVEHAKRDISAGVRPYSMEISASGEFAVVGNIGVTSGDADTISLIDLKANPARVVDTVTVGPTPEGVALSSDGKHVAVSVMNGSNLRKASPFFNDYGLVKVFATAGGKLTPVAEGRVGHWCQGMVWNRAGSMLLVQCMSENELQVFKFDGKALTPDAPVKLKASPAGIRTAL